MTSLPPINDFTPYTAPQLFAGFFSWGLFGIAASQTYFYYVNFPSDKLGIKLLVYGIFVADIIHTAIVGRDFYMTLAKGWGDPTALFNSQLIWFTGPVFSAVIGTVVQIFYAWRILMLTKSRILFGIITFISVSACATGLGLGIRSSVPDDTEVLKRAYGWAQSFIALSATCDTLISVCMIGWYMRVRRNGVFGSTSDIITRIIRYVIVSGLLTTAVSLVTLAMTLAYPNGTNFYFQCPSVVLGKVFSNSLLAMLNQRYIIREGQSTHYVYETMDHRGTQLAINTLHSQVASNAVQVTTTVERHGGQDSSMEMDALSKAHSGSNSYGRYEIKGAEFSV